MPTPLFYPPPSKLFSWPHAPRLTGLLNFGREGKSRGQFHASEGPSSGLKSFFAVGEGSQSANIGPSFTHCGTLAPALPSPPALSGATLMYADKVLGRQTQLWLDSCGEDAIFMQMTGNHVFMRWLLSLLQITVCRGGGSSTACAAHPFDLFCST